MKNARLVRELEQELTRNYEKYVRGVAKAAHTSRDNAREALHRAICRILGASKEHPPSRRILAWHPYILSAAINSLRDWRKEGKRLTRFSELYEDEREEIGEIPDPEPGPERRLEESEIRAILWAEVKRLSPREAEVIKHWAHGSPFNEIAMKLNISASTVRVLWMRGIRNLRNRPQVRRLVA